MNWFTYVSLGGAGALALGAIGPWATALGMSVSGMNGDGKIFLAAAAVAAIALLWKQAYRFTAVLGVLASIGAIVDCVRLIDGVTEADGLAAPAWGIYLTVIGALLLTVSALLARRSTVTTRRLIPSEQTA
jgi:hypothetical protein